jgi:hypothetical protein
MIPTHAIVFDFKNPNLKNAKPKIDHQNDTKLSWQAIPATLCTPTYPTYRMLSCIVRLPAVSRRPSDASVSIGKRSIIG